MSSELRAVAQGVWCVDRRIELGASVRLPLKMTVLSDAQGLVLVSPVAIDDALARALADLGQVHTLLAPNRLHHKYLASAQEAFPEARLLGAPGLAQKCPALTFDGVLESGELSPAIQTVLIRGSEPLSEVVVFHRPSRSLIVTDLVFNIRSANWMSRFVLRMLSGAYGRVEQSRLLRGMTKDRQAAAQSVREILRLPFERLIPAHGDIVEPEAREQLARALWWMRGKKSREEEVTWDEPTAHAS